MFEISDTAQKARSQWFANFRFQPQQQLLIFDAGQKKPSTGDKDACPLCFVEIKTTFDSSGSYISFSRFKLSKKLLWSVIYLKVK